MAMEQLNALAKDDVIIQKNKNDTSETIFEAKIVSKTTDPFTSRTILQHVHGASVLGLENAVGFNLDINSGYIQDGNQNIEFKSKVPKQGTISSGSTTYTLEDTQGSALSVNDKVAYLNDTLWYKGTVNSISTDLKPTIGFQPELRGLRVTIYCSSSWIYKHIYRSKYYTLFLYKSIS